MKAFWILAASLFPLALISRSQPIILAERAIVMLNCETGVAKSHGAGLLFGFDDEALYIVTANHLVRPHQAGRCSARFSVLPGKSFDVRVTKESFKLDLAVVELIDWKRKGLAPDDWLADVRLADFDQLRPDSRTVSLGQSDRAAWVRTPLDGYLGFNGLEIRFNANPANEITPGGAVFDDKGGILGIVIARRSNLVWAVPMTLLTRQLLAQRFPVFMDRPTGSLVVVENKKDGLMYVWIHHGTFRMGCSPLDPQCSPNENEVHNVRIAKGFWISQTEVTQAAYERVRGSNPSAFKGPTRPVEEVTWNDAQSFCKEIGGRLPTEAEWEYAARAGSEERLYGPLGVIAWVADFPRGTGTQPVGTREPNNWGLYDILGNVAEWTADEYSDNYPQSNANSTALPQRPSSEVLRVVRGGYIKAPVAFFRLSARQGRRPDDANQFTGFRCVLERDGPASMER